MSLFRSLAVLFCFASFAFSAIHGVPDAEQTNKEKSPLLKCMDNGLKHIIGKNSIRNIVNENVTKNFGECYYEFCIPTQKRVDIPRGNSISPMDKPEKTDETIIRLKQKLKDLKTMFPDDCIEEYENISKSIFEEIYHKLSCKKFLSMIVTFSDKPMSHELIKYGECDIFSYTTEQKKDSLFILIRTFDECLYYKDLKNLWILRNNKPND